MKTSLSDMRQMLSTVTRQPTTVGYFYGQPLHTKPHQPLTTRYIERLSTLRRVPSLTLLLLTHVTPYHIYPVLLPNKVIRNTSLILVFHNNGINGIGQMSLSSRRLKMTTQKQMAVSVRCWEQQDEPKLQTSWDVSSGGGRFWPSMSIDFYQS